MQRKGSAAGTAPSSKRAERTFLLALTLTALLLGVAYCLLTPTFTGPDEQDHLRYVQTLVESGGARVEGPQAKQPPTYYWLTSPAYLLTRGQPEAIQLLALRLLSLLLFAAEIALAYLTARLLAPGKPFVYLGATALVALLPGRLWLAATLNNDNLAILASSGLLYALTRGLRRGFDRPALAGLAVALVVTLFSKMTAWPILAVALLALLAVVCRRVLFGGVLRGRTGRLALAATALLLLVTGATLFAMVTSGQAAPGMAGVGQEDTLLRLIKGPLAPVDRVSGMRLTYIHTHLGWGTFLDIPDPRPEPFILQFQTFWFPLWTEDYGPAPQANGLALGMSLLALAGIAAGLLRLPFGSRGQDGGKGQVAAVVVFTTAILAVWVSCFLQFLMVVVGTDSFIPRRQVIWSTHARYIFPALVPIAYLLATGLGRFVPARWYPCGLALLVAALIYLQGSTLHNLVSRVYWWP